MFLESENCCTVKAVRMCIVMSEHPVVRAPSVWLLLPHVLTKLPQKVTVELCVDSLSWRDRFLTDNPITVLKADQH